MEVILLAIYLIVLSFFDSRECKVPLVLISGGFVMALVCLLCRCLANPSEWEWIVLTVVLGMLPGAFMAGASYITGKIGMGDGFVLMIAGMLIGYKRCLILLCFSLLIMSAWCIGVLSLKKGNRYTRIPYIPFLTTVYVAGMFM